MKVEYINPFVASVYELFSTMLGCEANRGDIGLTQEMGQPRDITALIGLSGPIRGIVVLSFPVNTALSIVSRLLGTEVRVVDESVLDSVAELVNIVAGGAKARLHDSDGPPVDLSLPSVVRGQRYSIEHPSRSTWLDVPFVSELGTFHLRVALESVGPLASEHQGVVAAARESR